MDFRRSPQIWCVVPALFLATLVFAQTPNRILRPIDSRAAVQIPNSVPPRIAAMTDMGRLDPATPLQGITFHFQPSPAQKAGLAALVQAQLTPGSPAYYAWITPSQYANRFGLNDADLAQVEGWLAAQGFSIDSVSPSHTSVHFSGTAGQVEQVFQTEMHLYQAQGQSGQQHFANATPILIPAALAGIVASVRNLNDFRPHPQMRFHAAPAFTSAQSGAHFLTPQDVATIYDINPAYSSGYNGSGQTIVVVGQSAIASTDIANFQNADGLTVKAPNVVLVPNSGTSTVVSGDEAESDLDLEYAGATAPGATIDFVYVGNNKNDSVFDALQYAVDNNLGPIINISYGACETGISAADDAALERVMEQAASQGQSIIAAAGDDGSTSCFGSKGMPLAQQEALAVNYPASSAYVTGLGGTEFPAADVASSNTTYWNSGGGSDLLSSALSWIPEQVWNDDSAAVGAQYGSQYALSAGGGGTSALNARPSWQTGVPGIPSGKFRLVPDISLDSSAQNAAYLYCTSDTSAWSHGQQSSCNSGFRDTSTQNLTVAGGTSFAAPIFSGMLAIINQKTNSAQGVAAATLYGLAANSATYASAFHDITSGSNVCTAGSSYCSSAGQSAYSAAPGYDEASGLGSVDFNRLLSAWPSPASSGGSASNGPASIASFTLSATSMLASPGTSATSTVTILSQNAFAGTVSFTLLGSNAALAGNACYTIASPTVAAGATTTATLTVYTSASACTSLSGAQSFSRTTAAAPLASGGGSPFHPSMPIRAAAVGGLLLFGFRRFRSRPFSALGCLLLIAMLGVASGCGSNSSPSVATNNSANPATSTQLAAGTYALTLTGTDAANSAITASTSVTLTVN
jgi:subtilase family serine protease